MKPRGQRDAGFTAAVAKGEKFEEKDSRLRLLNLQVQTTGKL